MKSTKNRYAVVIILMLVLIMPSIVFNVFVSDLFQGDYSELPGDVPSNESTPSDTPSGDVSNEEDTPSDKLSGDVPDGENTPNDTPSEDIPNDENSPSTPPSEEDSPKDDDDSLLDDDFSEDETPDDETSLDDDSFKEHALVQIAFNDAKQALELILADQKDSTIKIGTVIKIREYFFIYKENCIFSRKMCRILRLQ